ncbi:MAG: DUF4251 domain-containing protein [Rikenellaceae bacterium]
MRNLFFLVILLITTNSVAFSQTKKEKKEEKKAQRALETIQALEQMVLVDTSFYFGLKSTGSSYGSSSGAGFYFKVEDGEVDCYLPFFGRSYTATLSGGGVEFTSDQFTYKTEPNPENEGWTINMDVMVKNYDKYGITLHASPSGNSLLIVNPPNKSAMSYYGAMEEN